MPKKTQNWPSIVMQLAVCVELNHCIKLRNSVDAHTHSYVRTYMHTYIHTYILWNSVDAVRVFTYTHTCIHTYIRISKILMYSYGWCVCVYIHTPFTYIHHILTHMYVHLYIYTHTCIKQIMAMGPYAFKYVCIYIYIYIIFIYIYI